MNEEQITEDTPMEEKTLNTVLLILPWIILLVTVIRNAYASRKAGKSWEETFTIIINTLKDEDKMIAGGFSPDALAKAKEIGAVIGAGKEAQAKAEEALTQGKETSDIKIGSLNGKPIYLGSALGIGSALAGVVNGFRK